MSSPRHHVLCVEDDPDTCEVLSEAFPDLAFTFAHSLEGGLKLARCERFDLFLLDNWLPDGSGVDLCREIRMFDVGTPIVFLSAAAYSHDHEEAMAAGATAYFDKPIDLDQLNSALTSLLRGVRSQQAKIRRSQQPG